MNTLPPRLHEYCQRCLPIAKVDDRQVRIRQQGEIRLSPSKPWMPFTAVQTMSCEQIEFKWNARFKMAWFIPGSVVDCFENGRGKLDAWIFRFIRVAHARGPNVDLSEIQRYLAEIAWCPFALRSNDSLRFRELSTDCVRISAFDDKTYVDLLFDSESDIRGVRSLTRYRDQKTQPWGARFADYKSFGDVRMPTFGEVWWDAPEGRFVYWRGKVTEFSLSP